MFFKTLFIKPNKFYNNIFQSIFKKSQKSSSQNQIAFF